MPRQISYLKQMLTFLLEERGEWLYLEDLSEDEIYQKWRALVNQRSAQPIVQTYLDLEAKYLTFLAKQNQKGLESCQTTEFEQISLYRGDLCYLKVDALVNAANSDLQGCFIPNHSCLDNALHTHAGVHLRLDCAQIIKQQGHREAVGQAKLTSAYHLPAAYLIHTVGPYVSKGGKVSSIKQDMLRRSYQSCLNLATEKGFKSIAFPAISTGEFGFPKELAAQIAVDTVMKWLTQEESDLNVVFAIFNDEDWNYYQKELCGEENDLEDFGASGKN